MKISVKEQIISIRNILKEKKKCCFEDLFSKATKDYIIATFLAILEMTKQKEIILEQRSSFEPIMVEMI